MRCVKHHKHTYGVALESAAVKRAFEAKRFKEEVDKHKKIEVEQNEKMKKGVGIGSLKLIHKMGIMDKIRLDKTMEDTQRLKMEKEATGERRKLPKIVTDHVSTGIPISVDDVFRLSPKSVGGSASPGVPGVPMSFLTPTRLGRVGGTTLSPLTAPLSDPTYDRKRLRGVPRGRGGGGYYNRLEELKTPSTATGRGVYSGLLSLNKKGKFDLSKSLRSTVYTEQKVKDLMHMAKKNQSGRKYVVGEGIMRPKTGISKVQPIVHT